MFVHKVTIGPTDVKGFPTEGQKLYIRMYVCMIGVFYVGLGVWFILWVTNEILISEICLRAHSAGVCLASSSSGRQTVLL